MPDYQSFVAKIIELQRHIKFLGTPNPHRLLQIIALLARG
ncbi:MAG: hypothetical protein ACI9W6_001277 [Motiliproteus sp.]|jgi:hypothetical protein